MIHASELRIGNWVKRDTQPEGFQIDARSFIVHERSPETYEPIPLSEEWLVRLGFVDNELSAQPNVFVYHNGGVYVRGMSGAIHPKDVHYVHQLQNLYFALTGEELKLSE